MKANWPKAIVSGITALSLLASVPVIMPQSVQAAASTTAKVTLSGQAVRLTPSAVLSVRDAQFLMQNQGKVLAFTVLVNNSGSTSLNLMDYWVKVSNRSGKQYKLSLLEDDKTKSTVPPGTSAYLTYYGYVDATAKLGDLTYHVVEWDFDLPDYERTIGSIKSPANFTGKTPDFQPNVILFNGSKLKGAIKSYVVARNKTNTNVTFQFLVENVGFQTVDLGKLNFHVQTDSGTVFKATAPAGLTAAPNERKYIAVDVSLPNNVAVKPLSLIPSYSDEKSKVEVPIGAFAVKLKETAPAAAGAARTVYINGQTVHTTASTAVVYQSGNENELALQFILKNTGTQAVNDAGLTFYAESSDGTLYPLEYDKNESAALVPGIEKSISVSGKIPHTLDTSKARIVLKAGAAENSAGYMAGVYAIQTQAASGDAASGSTTAYKANGYEVQLLNVNRVPTTSDDVLVAELEIKNSSEFPIKVPNLTGYFVADGVRLTTATSAVDLDQTINVAPNSTHQVAVYTKIPYTSFVDKVAFVLTEEQEGKAGRTLYQFAGKRIDSATRSITAPYTINNAGRKAQVKVKTTQVSEQNGDRYFYGEFDLVNKESRATAVTQLSGYLEDRNGLLVPLTFTTVTEKILPDGKTLFASAGKLPSEFDLNNYKLYVGQSVPVVNGEQTEYLLVFPAAYRVTSTPQVNTTLKNIPFGSFDLSFSEMNAGIRLKGDFIYEGIELKFKYTMNKDDSYKAFSKDHKLVIELVDQGASKPSYSKEFRLSETATGEEEVFYDGKDVRQEIYFADEKLMTKIRSFQKFKFNVYVKVGDQKVLIGSKEFDWLRANTF